MAERLITPQSAPLGADGHLRPEWQKYLSGIETLSKRLDGIADLAGGASLADVISKINEILQSYQTE